MWVLEFTGTSIGQAQDVVRQHTLAGEMVPVVEKSGRLGFTVQVADGDYGIVAAARDHVIGDGGDATVRKRWVER